MNFKRTIKIILIISILINYYTANNVILADDSPAEINVLDMGLEDLMNVEITSVSKKEQKVSEAAAAIFVITAEDIRRSGATSIPEALRLAPGLHVAKVNATDWAITSRGFNNLFANKLLVVIDGRTVYTPAFSGVYWQAQDTLIEDIERIEVIRGPGGTLWGANAVNGVINIITRKSVNTQGALTTASIGTELNSAGVRYGDKIGENSYGRAYVKSNDYDDSESYDGDDSYDSSEMYQGGFRADLAIDKDDSLTIQGDIYTSQIEKEYLLPSGVSPFTTLDRSNADAEGLNMLAKWDHTYSDTSKSMLQFYYDRTNRREILSDQYINTYDLEFQHNYEINETHNLTWGLGYRGITDDLNGSEYIYVSESRDAYSLVSGFLQDDIKLTDNLTFTLGTKLEHNDYTGMEVQPNVRLSYLPNEHNTVWTSVSRAIRSPSRIEDDVTAILNVTPGPDNLPVSSTVFGSHSFHSEELIAYETGYRYSPDKEFFFDITAFYFDYDSLSTNELGAPYLNGSGITAPLNFDNSASADSYGVELLADYHLFQWWKLKATYTFLELHEDFDSGSTDPQTTVLSEENPENQYMLRNHFDLPYDLEFDAILRYVDNLPDVNIPAYHELDLRIGWKLNEKIEFSVIGKNLLDNSHPEYIQPAFGTVPVEIERAVLGKIICRF